MGLFTLELTDEFKELVDAHALRVSSVKAGRNDNIYKVMLSNVNTGEIISCFIETPEADAVKRIEFGQVIGLSFAEEKSVFGRGWSRRLSDITVIALTSSPEEEIITIIGL